MNRYQINFRMQLALIFALVVVFHGNKLFLGFSSDEIVFLKLVPPLKLSDLSNYFDPGWGWYYRPLFLVYFGGIRWILGDNPVAFHALNILFHGIAAIGVSLLAKRLGIPWAGLAGATFVALTANNEVPEWISSVTSIFSVIGMVGSLLCWLAFIENRRKSDYFATLGCMVLALLSKEESAAIPILLLVFDLWKRPSISLKLRFVELLPFACTLGVYLVLALIAHSNAVVFSNQIAPNPLTIYPLLNGAFGNFFNSTNSIIALGSLGTIAFLSLKKPDTRVFLLSLVIILAPVPLAVGSYAINSRFWYAGAVFSSMILVSIFSDSKLTQTNCFQGWRSVVVAFYILVLVPPINLVINRSESDLTTSILLVAALLMTLVAWRNHRLPTDVFILVIGVAVCSQLDLAIYRISVQWPNLFALILVCGYGIYLMRRISPLQWWHGVLASAALLYYPPITLSLFAVSYFLHIDACKKYAHCVIDLKSYLMSNK
jgi:hypothetical protein